MNDHAQRPPAEVRYADELARLNNDDRPPGWVEAFLRLELALDLR
jgi:hypothetical protein